MKNENANALKDALEAYAKDPTYGHELYLTLMISIATSLACIADVMMEREERDKPFYYIDADKLAAVDKLKLKQLLNEQFGTAVNSVKEVSEDGTNESGKDGNSNSQ